MPTYSWYAINLTSSALSLRGISIDLADLIFSSSILDRKINFKRTEIKNNKIARSSVYFTSGHTSQGTPYSIILSKGRQMPPKLRRRTKHCKRKTAKPARVYCGADN